MRIASLLASGTEIACALGLERHIVAISHECDYPSGVLDRPRVSRPLFDPDGLDSGALDAAVRESMSAHGAVYAVDHEALGRLDPDLVLTQAVCEVCAVPTSAAAAAVRSLPDEPSVLSLDAHTLDGILETIDQVGRAARVQDAAEGLVADLRARLDRVRRRVAGRSRPRVLALEWLDPPFVPGHWVPEMIEIAGGRNLRGSTGQRSTEAGWSELAGLDPDALIVMPCGYGLEAARRDADRSAARLAELAPRAVSEGRAFVVDASSYFNRSGPRVVDGVEILAALLHPPVSGDIPLEGRATRWEP